MTQPIKVTPHLKVTPHIKVTPHLKVTPSLYTGYTGINCEQNVTATTTAEVTTVELTTTDYQSTTNLNSVVNTKILDVIGNLDLGNMDNATKQALLDSILTQLYASFNITS